MTRFGGGDLVGFVEHNARAIGLLVSDASMPAVLANMLILADHAERVMDCALPPETPIATDFRP